ncbi:MAG: ribokinase [Stellaceae bacterium]
MILVFGSINVDLTVPVPHLPGPGETVLGGDYRLLGGGKGANQALAARRAGAEVILVGAVGQDAFAAVALDPLERAGIDVSLVRRVAQPTGCAAIMVSAGGENLIAVASGANMAVRAGEVPDGRLGPGTVLVAQMEVPLVESASVIRQARARGALVMLNLAPAMPLDADLLQDIDFLVANKGEAAAFGEEPGAIAARLRRALIVTRGAAGATAYLAAGATLRVPALPIVAVDTTGAGDTFVGVLAAALNADAPLDMALQRASAAAGLACLACGAQGAMPDAGAIDQAVERLPAV